ncbi:hypothetical protein [Actinomadura macrotermitis]|uniref:Uncharacterized protein n=1 Tax=Actinomadura macrotermitis TaxID=2585200 RepID=A0A7K0C470_9ACTN|nr:hypothetical protein [Actinomadura macrotermitis]MQY08235.1 hypothetical protein [Actinomadura macrotermitis]
MPTPPPHSAPDDTPARSLLGRFLYWLTPDGPHDDWLEPDPDPDGEDTAEGNRPLT